MIRKVWLPLMLIIGLFPQSKAHAGSCIDHIRINSIANLQTDGADFLMHAESFTLGGSFSVGPYNLNSPPPTTTTFRIAAAQNADFKKNSMSILLAAKAAKETIYIQVSYVSPAVFQIEKVAEGSAKGLECSTY